MDKSDGANAFARSKKRVLSCLLVIQANSALDLIGVIVKRSYGSKSTLNLGGR